MQWAYRDYGEGYGFKIDACPPRDPKKKERVESGVKYVKRNFLPLRTFRDLNDTNHQLQQWILEEAGNRIHGSTHEKPLTRFATEQALLIPLPDCPPEAATWAKVKVHRDAHVQFEKCLYSAYAVIQCQIHVTQLLLPCPVDWAPNSRNFVSNKIFCRKLS